MKKDMYAPVLRFFAGPTALIIVSAIFAASTYLVWSDTYGIAYVTESSGGLSVLDVAGPFSAQEAYRHIASMGEEGRAAYRAFHAGIDLIYPLAYALFGLSLIAVSCGKMMTRYAGTRLLLSAPLLSALCDYLENYFISRMLTEFPSETPVYAVLANLFHMGKPLFGFIALLAVISGLGFRFICSKVAEV